MNEINNSSYPLQKLVRLLLFALCVLLAGILWFEFNPTDPNIGEIDVANVDSPPIDIEVDLKESVFPEITAFNEIIERPLFDETRQPFVASKPEKTVAKPKQKNNQTRKKQEQFSLSAVVITPDKKIAILQIGRKKSLQRVTLVESIEGWSLDEVTSHSIRLKKGTEIKNLELEIKGSKIKQGSKLKSKSKPSTKTGTSEKDGKIQKQSSVKKAEIVEKPGMITGKK